MFWIGLCSNKGIDYKRMYYKTTIEDITEVFSMEGVRTITKNSNRMIGNSKFWFPTSDFRNFDSGL